MAIAPQNECIPFYSPGQDITGYATAAVTGKRFLKISGNRKATAVLNTSTTGGNYSVAPADAGGKAFGVSKYDAAIDTLVGVIHGPGYVIPVTADGAITAGDLIQVGTAGKAKTAVNGAATAATLATGVVGSNNAITWTAADAGFAGNGISVRLRDPAGNGASLSVTVTGNDIVVNLATDGGGVITSTATLVIAAIAASAAATALVTAANTGISTGAGVVAAVAATNLAGGADPGPGRIVGQALTAATDGNDAEISLFV